MHSLQALKAWYLHHYFAFEMLFAIIAIGTALQFLSALIRRSWGFYVWMREMFPDKYQIFRLALIYHRLRQLENFHANPSKLVARLANLMFGLMLCCLGLFSILYTSLQGIHTSFLAIAVFIFALTALFTIYCGLRITDDVLDYEHIYPLLLAKIRKRMLGHGLSEEEADQEMMQLISKVSS